MYFIEKQGAYGHGVFWIGEDLEFAKKEADRFSQLDRDGHHEWQVKLFGLDTTMPRNAPDSWNSYQFNAEHKVVYTARKGHKSWPLTDADLPTGIEDE